MQTVGYPAGNSLLSGTQTSQPPMPVGENIAYRTDIPLMRDALTGEFFSGGDSVGNGGNYSALSGTLAVDWQLANGTWAVTSANGGGEAAGVDLSVLCDGLPMAKITCGNTGTLIAQYVFNTPVTIAQMQSMQIPLRMSQNNSVFNGSAPLQIWFFDDATGTRQWRLVSSLDTSQLRPGVTTTLSFGPGVAADGWAFGGSSAPTNTSDMDAFTINRIQFVQAVPGAVAGQSMWFGPLRLNGRRKPVVTICLDGEYASQARYILPMLEAQGLRASLAIQNTAIGTGGRMSAAQLDTAYSAGHEMIHHTYDASKTTGYQNSGQWPTQASITADIQAGEADRRSRGWLRGLGYAVHGGNVNPYNGTVSAARQAIVTAAYQAAGIKAIREGNAAGTGPLNKLQNMSRLSNVDAYTVQGALQWTNTDNAASLTAAVTRAKARGEWAIYTGHRSVISAPAALEVLNSDILSWVQSLGDDVRSGRVLCLPFSEACVYYGLTSA